MLTLDEALCTLAGHVVPRASETVSLRQAAGRVLAQPIHARSAAPRCAVSAMDGYAVRSDDLALPGTKLRLVGEAFAGAGFAGTVGAGEAVRIFTGAPVPTGADRVVIQEVVERNEDRIAITGEVGPSPHIRAAGCDFMSGDRLLEIGDLLTPRAMVVAAGADVAELVVARVPQVTVISTGDELAEPGSAHLHPDMIPESVSIGVAAMAEEWGGQVIAMHRAADRLDDLGALAGRALATSDLVVVTGGASVGERDFAKPMFACHGMELLFSKVAIKPGKPVWLGRCGPTFVLGLPGNPSAALSAARLFLAPLLSGLLGRRRPPALGWSRLPLAERIKPSGTRESLVRARWTAEGLSPLADQDSFSQRTLIMSDWLIRRAPGEGEAAAGSLVNALPF